MTDREGRDDRRERIRSRVLRHLRRLMVAGAAGGAAALEVGGCVCDPLPPPHPCEGPEADQRVNDFLGISALWRASDDQWYVDISLSLQQGPYDWDFSGPPVLTRATLLAGSLVFGEHTMEFSIQPEENATSVGVSVPVNCDHFSLSGGFQLDVSGEKSSGETVPPIVAEPQDPADP